MIYCLKHFDTTLLKFSANADSSDPDYQILWINGEKKDLLPLTMEPTEESLEKWLRHRTIPKNRAFVHNFLAKCGLNLNRPMSIIAASKGLSLNDCYWMVDENFEGSFAQYNLYENRFSNVLADNESNQIAAPAPLFDHDNSLFTFGGGAAERTAVEYKLPNVNIAVDSCHLDDETDEVTDLLEQEEPQQVKEFLNSICRNTHMVVEKTYIGLTKEYLRDR